MKRQRTATIGASLLLGTCVPASGQLDELLFSNPEFRVGDFPSSLARADLDGDGDVDFVVANSGDFDLFGIHTGTTVSVLLNRGDGIFLDPIDLQVGLGPITVAVDDFNGDDHIDIAVSNKESADVTVLMNTGDGVTYLANSFFAGPSAFGLATGDLTGDGRSDIVVTNLGTSFDPFTTISVLRNLGKGSFVLESVIEVGLRPAAAAISDLDADGTNDVVVGNFDAGTIAVLLNDEELGLGAPMIFNANSGNNEGPSGIAIGDLNGDLIPDLAVSQAAGFPSDGRVSVFLGDGDGTFGREIPLLGGLNVRSVALNDLDIDGDLDIVAPNKDAADVSVFINIGDATFAEHLRFPVGFRTNHAIVVDVDNDGRVDLVSTNEFVDNLSVLRGNGDATFRADQRFQVGSEPTAIAHGDIDADGDSDLVVANSGSFDVTVLFNDGEGGFEDAMDLPIDGLFPQTIALVDMDGDDDADLVVGAGDDFGFGFGDLIVMLNDGAGSFPFQSVADFDGSPTDLVAGDFDGDGDQDLAITSGGFMEGIIGITIVINAGNGVVTPGQTIILPEAPTAIVSADFNDDGALDLAATVSDEVIVFVGSNDGTFVQVGAFGAGERPLALAVADVNDDGAVDLITANRGQKVFNDLPTGRTVSVMIGTGKATFAEPNEFDAGIGPTAIDIADIDGDGDLDIAVANAPGNAAVLLNDAEGGFLEHARFGIGFDPAAIIATDLDGDGAVDLASANSFAGEVSVLTNQSDASVPGDLDGDGVVGTLDLIALLGAWGVCPPRGDCPADLDGDGHVGTTDLLLLLGNWG